MLEDSLRIRCARRVITTHVITPHQSDRALEAQHAVEALDRAACVLELPARDEAYALWVHTTHELRRNLRNRQLRGTQIAAFCVFVLISVAQTGGYYCGGSTVGGRRSGLEAGGRRAGVTSSSDSLPYSAFTSAVSPARSSTSALVPSFCPAGAVLLLSASPLLPVRTSEGRETTSPCVCGCLQKMEKMTASRSTERALCDRVLKSIFRDAAKSQMCEEEAQSKTPQYERAQGPTAAEEGCWRTLEAALQRALACESAHHFEERAEGDAVLLSS